MVLDAERHGVGKVLLERVGRHSLQTVGIYAVHEFLKSENRNRSAAAEQRLCAHHPGEQIPDDRRDDQCSNQQRDRGEEILEAEELEEAEWQQRENDSADVIGIRGVRIDQVHPFDLSADITLVRIVGSAV